MNTIEILLNNSCKFHYGDEPDSWYKGYDASDWQDITLPHDWSVTMAFSKEYSSGTGYLAGGIGWYRIPFKLPPEYKNKKISVIFDGVYKNSQVWCNSYYLGKRPNGYTTFAYDLSSFLNFGEEENVICVKVTHTDIADSRWFTGSGITRKVTLKVEEPLHTCRDGVFFNTLRLDSTGAIVEILHEVQNDSRESATFTLESHLVDFEGNEVLALSCTETIESFKTCNLKLNGRVPNPKLWSPNSPYLYKLNTFLRKDGDMPYLVSSVNAGIRTIRFDANEGFFLNEVSTLFKGVCVHHDGGVLGAAMYKDIWKRRLLKLKVMGCNAIRCSHNPHMPELYELCDELGFLMMDEAFDEWENAKNKWSTGHNVYPPKHQGYYEDFHEWHEKDLREMVRRDRSHPCIVMWSIGNEIDYPNDPYCHPLFNTMTGNNDANKPAAERMYNPDKPNAERLTIIATKLADIVRLEDSTRPVTLAAAFPELSSQLGLFTPLDVVGYNYKEQFYERDHKRFPDKPFLGSENSHSFEAWNAVAKNSYISGQFIWTGIDYLGEAHGWPIHGSGAGLLTLAGFEKPGYFMRSSLWNDQPVIYLVTAKEDGNLGEWKQMNASYNYETSDSVLVRVYSNLPKVTLLINNRILTALNEKTAFGYYEYIMPYEPGTLTATDGNTPASLSTSLTTSGPATSLAVHVWDLDAEILQLEISVLDNEGTLVPTNSAIIDVKVESGRLLGLENGDLADVTPYTSTSRHTYNGLLIAYIQRDLSLPLRATFSSPDIKSMTISL